jgi:hypothetical protein
MGFGRLLHEVHDELTAIKLYGFEAILDNLINFRRTWSLDDQAIQSLGKSESLSDTNTYLSLVELATSNEEYFARFKSNKSYRQILEHVSRKFGQEYWDVIKRYEKGNTRLDSFISQDFCNPYRFTYSGIGRVSSTNLRYAKIALDLENLFGSTNLLNIVEVGIGYGGQAIAINELNGFLSYEFVDLPQVKKLAGKYLNKFYPSINPKLSHNRQEWDLLISNYAFSELSREIQEEYLEKYISKSKRGYVIFNDITDNLFSTYSVSEFLEKIPGAEMVNEFPLTFPRNKLIVWGHSNIDALIQK